MKTRFLITTLCAALTLSAFAGPTKPIAKAQGGMAGMDMQKCMADMRDAQKKLSDLVYKMKYDTGVDKIDSTIAVVEEMAKQQMAMQDMCMMMMRQMDRSMKMPLAIGDGAMKKPMPTKKHSKHVHPWH